jgi:hypothetical protein
MSHHLKEVAMSEDKALETEATADIEEAGVTRRGALQ